MGTSSGVRTAELASRQRIILAQDAAIKDLKFVDDMILLLVVQTSSESGRHQLEKSNEAASSHLVYATFRDEATSRGIGSQPGIEKVDGKKANRDRHGFMPNIDLSNPTTMEACTRHTFPNQITWLPETIEINGRKGRRAVCVVAQDRIHYRVFDIDPPPKDDGLEAVGMNDL